MKLPRIVSKIAFIGSLGLGSTAYAGGNSATFALLNNLSGGLTIQNNTRTVDGYAYGKKFKLMVQRVPLTDRGGNPVYLRSDAAEGFMNMMTEAVRAGFFLGVNYSFRSHKKQTHMWNYYNSIGQDGRAARPGYSTHQSGVSIDISGCYRDIDGKRHMTMKFWWLKANGKKFGFTNDVPSEPWHWTYVTGK